MSRTDKKHAIAADAGDAVSVPIEQELCGAKGFSFGDPMHAHVCTIVLVGEPDVDEHDFHACYCGGWWHDR